MRLALLSPLPPDQTGLADYASRFRQAINQAGVEVLTPLAGQRPIDDLAGARAWIAERDWRRVDVVHAELAPGRHSEFHTLCALAEMPHRPALSVTVHAPDRLIWEPVHRLWPTINGTGLLPPAVKRSLAWLSDPVTVLAERRLAQHIDGLAVHTQTGAARLIKRMKLSVDKVSVIPHGALSLAQRPLPVFDPMHVIYLGPLCPQHGIEDLIDALGRLRTQAPELADAMRLTLAGVGLCEGGAPSEQAYLTQLRARIAKRGLIDLIEWEFEVDPRDIHDLLLRHHLVVLPHRQPIRQSLLGQLCASNPALNWAIACGRGCIVADTQTLAEEVSHGNGVSYRAGDVAALATHLREVLLQPDTLRQWGLRASAMAQERAWSTTGQRFVGHFQRAMARAPRAKGVSSEGPASVWTSDRSA
jgi:glycosyltransferase involved in cell wall biosynthesis